jgi:hypothetical protein
MTNHDVVNKLIGNIRPVGETNEDNKRLENLKEMCSLVESILYDIDDLIYRNKDAHEASIKRSVDYATKFMQTNVEQFTKPFKV